MRAIGATHYSPTAFDELRRMREGAIPVLPLLIRIPVRSMGLLVVLLLGLQVLTLLELVARLSLAERNEEIAGLVPGNPKMRTAAPTGERLLAAFGNLHLLALPADGRLQTRLVETLSSLQQYTSSSSSRPSQP